MNNPFYKSKKFVYAVGTLLAALVIAVLPMAVDLDANTVDMLEAMLPLVFVIGAMVITGHTVTDIMAVWSEGVKTKDLKTALLEMVEVLPLDEVPDSEGSDRTVNFALRPINADDNASN